MIRNLTSPKVQSVRSLAQPKIAPRMNKATLARLFPNQHDTTPNKRIKLATPEKESLAISSHVTTSPGVAGDTVSLATPSRQYKRANVVSPSSLRAPTIVSWIKYQKIEYSPLLIDRFLDRLVPPISEPPWQKIHPIFRLPPSPNQVHGLPV